MAPTFARCRPSWGTPISRRPKFIPTSRIGACAIYTTSSMGLHEKNENGKNNCVGNGVGCGRACHFFSRFYWLERSWRIRSWGNERVVTSAHCARSFVAGGVGGFSNISKYVFAFGSVCLASAFRELGPALAGFLRGGDHRYGGGICARRDPVS